VIAAGEADALRSALGQLPDAQAQVITLAFFGELTHTEIAKQLDLPSGTVKGRMRLGLEKLRRSSKASWPPSLTDNSTARAYRVESIWPSGSRSAAGAVGTTSGDRPEAAWTWGEPLRPRPVRATGAELMEQTRYALHRYCHLGTGSSAADPPPRMPRPWHDGANPPEGNQRQTEVRRRYLAAADTDPSTGPCQGPRWRPEQQPALPLPLPLAWRTRCRARAVGQTPPGTSVPLPCRSRFIWLSRAVPPA